MIFDWLYNFEVRTFKSLKKNKSSINVFSKINVPRRKNILFDAKLEQRLVTLFHFFCCGNFGTCINGTGQYFPTLLINLLHYHLSTIQHSKFNIQHQEKSSPHRWQPLLDDLGFTSWIFVYIDFNNLQNTTMFPLG
jgi:hypothetical protein